jgi:hypothetical protein
VQAKTVFQIRQAPIFPEARQQSLIRLRRIYAEQTDACAVDLDVSPSMTIACSARSASADFEGETTENRLARRRRNWTPEAVRGGVD